MAREHTKIYLSVWDDDDFTALSAHQQWTYWALCMSPDLSYCGVLPNLPKRTAALASDQNPRKVQAALEVLARQRFIVMDDETDEVLVRAHIRRDGVLKQPNIIRAMNKAFDKVRSEALRKVICEEVARAIEEGFPEGFAEPFAKAFAEGFAHDLIEGL